jgi:RNA binding exosome subunit
MEKTGAQTSKIAQINIRVSSHATEDPEKVQTAIRNLLPEENRQDITFEKNSLTGHHGNPIILFSTTLTDKNVLPKILDLLGSKLSSLDKDALLQDLALHLEKSNMFLRFDKQSAFMGLVHFSSVDPIHLKIHFKTKNEDEIRQILQNSGLLP